MWNYALGWILLSYLFNQIIIMVSVIINDSLILIVNQGINYLGHISDTVTFVILPNLLVVTVIIIGQFWVLVRV